MSAIDCLGRPELERPSDHANDRDVPSGRIVMHLTAALRIVMSCWLTQQDFADRL